MRSDITILGIARGARPARATIRERWEISSERLRILVTAPNRVRQARCCGALLLRKAISSCAAVAVCGRRPRPHDYGDAVSAAVLSPRRKFAGNIGSFWSTHSAKSSFFSKHFPDIHEPYETTVALSACIRILEEKTPIYD